MISINGLTVAYGGYTLLDSIDFHISEKDKIGLVGKNGAGKSTIMKLICGLQSPTSGSIDKPNDLRIGYLPQIMEHHKGRTVMEETLTAFDHITEIQAELDSVNAQLAERTDYESDEYLSLINRLNDLTDAMAMSQSEPPEVLAQKTLLGLGFKDALWFIFLVAGILVALGHVYFPPEYFPNEQSLFPNWPIFDKMGTITLFLISMFMLIFPKFLGMIIYLKNNKFKNIGGFFGISISRRSSFSLLINAIWCNCGLMFI